MVCPLRYVVAAVSVVVALAVLYWSSAHPVSELAAGETPTQRRRREVLESAERDKSRTQKLIDFFTGAYLMHQWKIQQHWSKVAQLLGEEDEDHKEATSEVSARTKSVHSEVVHKGDVLDVAELDKLWFWQR